MPRDGSLTPRDLIGKLDVLRVACEEMRACCCTPASLSRFRSHVDRQLAMVYLAMKVLDRD
jgi:hypothetical protein